MNMCILKRFFCMLFLFSQATLSGLQRTISTSSFSRVTHCDGDSSPNLSEFSSTSLNSLDLALSSQIFVNSEQKSDDEEQKAIIFLSGPIITDEEQNRKAMAAIDFEELDFDEQTIAETISRQAAIVPAQIAEPAEIENNIPQEQAPASRPQGAAMSKKVALHLMRWAPAFVTAGIATYGVCHVRRIQAETVNQIVLQQELLAQQQALVTQQAELKASTITAQKYGAATNAAIVIGGIILRIILG